jgi:hypothetical protein
MISQKPIEIDLGQSIVLTVPTGSETNTTRFVKVGGKPDGKNCGQYDGIYVKEVAYQRVRDRQVSFAIATGIQKPLTTDLLRYDESEIFFLKEFPQKEADFVEGFCEMFMGKIVQKLMKAQFIPEGYHNCFSPADTVKINDSQIALKQPYKRGTIPLFRTTNPNQKRKNVLAELARKKIFNENYNPYLKIDEGVEQLGLSMIIMIMILLGNYSLHSGNILVKETRDTSGKVTKHEYISIDYGAALRGIFTTIERVNESTNKWGIFNSIQDLFHKKYPHYYKNIPNLFDSVREHAKILFQSLQDEQKMSSFSNIIEATVNESYHAYRAFIVNSERADGIEYWQNTARPTLLKYLYGEDHYNSFKESAKTNRFNGTNEQYEDQKAIQLLNEDMQAIIQFRLKSLAEWQRPVHSNPIGQRYTSVKKAPRPYSDKSASSEYNIDENFTPERNSDNYSERNTLEARDSAASSALGFDDFYEADETSGIQYDLVAFEDLDLLEKIYIITLNLENDIIENTPKKKNSTTSQTELIIAQDFKSKLSTLDKAKKLIQDLKAEENLKLLILFRSFLEQRINVSISPIQRFVNGLRTSRNLYSLFPCWQYRDTNTFCNLLDTLNDTIKSLVESTTNQQILSPHDRQILTVIMSPTRSAIKSPSHQDTRQQSIDSVTDDENTLSAVRKNLFSSPERPQSSCI